MGFYEDMEKSLLEDIEIEKGNVPLKERKGMPAKTYVCNENLKDLTDEEVWHEEEMIASTERIDFETDLCYNNKQMVTDCENDLIKNTENSIMESDNMNLQTNDSNGYRRLDFSKLNFSSNTITYDQALKDVEPMMFGEDVLSGKKKIKITKAEKDYKKKCVKLETSY